MKQSAAYNDIHHSFEQEFASTSQSKSKFRICTTLQVCKFEKSKSGIWSADAIEIHEADEEDATEMGGVAVL